MKAIQLIPELLVENMPKTLQFYQEVLSFKTEITFPEENPIFTQVGKDNIHIMLYDRGEFEKEIPKMKELQMGGATLIYIKVEGLEEYYKQIKDNVTIIQPLHKTDYGRLEVTIEDCNGYLIAFSE